MYQIFILASSKNIFWFVLTDSLKHLLTAVFLMVLYRRFRADALRVSWQTLQGYVLPEHALYSVQSDGDDGPEQEAQTRQMLDEAYAHGTRVICFTPPFSSGDLPHHRCRQNVLVDFSTDDPAEQIIRGLHDLMNHGYRPILAHAERYRDLSMLEIRGLRPKGVLIQTDTQFLLGGFGLAVKLRAGQMLREDLIDIISSDAHDSTRRGVDMGACYQLIKRKKGAACAEALCASIARQLLYTK